MIGAVIHYGKNTLVAELPMGTMDIQMKLSSIGVGEPAGRIPLKGGMLSRHRCRVSFRFSAGRVFLKQKLCIGDSAVTLKATEQLPLICLFMFFYV